MVVDVAIAICVVGAKFFYGLITFIMATITKHGIKTKQEKINMAFYYYSKKNNIQDKHIKQGMAILLISHHNKAKFFCLL